MGLCVCKRFTWATTQHCLNHNGQMGCWLVSGDLEPCGVGPGRTPPIRSIGIEVVVWLAEEQELLNGGT